MNDRQLASKFTREQVIILVIAVAKMLHGKISERSNPAGTFLAEQMHLCDAFAVHFYGLRV